MKPWAGQLALQKIECVADMHNQSPCVCNLPRQHDEVNCGLLGDLERQYPLLGARRSNLISSART